MSCQFHKYYTIILRTNKNNSSFQVCTELDKEKDDDTEEIKKKRFEAIISLMQEVQACGQLPEELIGEQTAPFQIDTEGDSVIPTLLRSMESSQNCCLMQINFNNYSQFLWLCNTLLFQKKLR